MKRRVSICLVSVVGIFCTTFVGEALAERPASFRTAVAKAKPAVVYIESIMGGSTARGSGSGVIIDAAQGHVLTASHVVERASEVHVRLEDGRQFTAKNIWRDEFTDIAIIQIEGENLPEARLGDSDALEVGDWVLAIGSPLGRMLENSVSAGIVSAKGRRTGILGRLGVEDFIQTDAVINRGNSGGPLVNTAGEVVGINSNIISSTGMYAGIGFAVPSNLVKSVSERLTTAGRVDRGYLGVQMQDLRYAEEERPGRFKAEVLERGGVLITAVEAGGPAEAAGLRGGDVLVEIDGKAVRQARDVISYINTMSPGSKVVAKVVRPGGEVESTVTLGERKRDDGAVLIPEEVVNRTAYRHLGLLARDYSGFSMSARGVSRLNAVQVEYVRPGSPAEVAGVKAGDVIIGVNNRTIRDMSGFNARLEEADLSRGVMLSIIDSNGERSVRVRVSDDDK